MTTSFVPDSHVVKVTLWDMPGGMSLTFTEQQLVDAGVPTTEGIMKLQDLAELFRCNVTMTSVINRTVHYSEEYK